MIWSGDWIAITSRIAGVANETATATRRDCPLLSGNADGKPDRVSSLDAQDAIWPSLKLWIDYNHDGMSQPWEIFSLSEKGIKALDLHYELSNRRDSHGNLFRYWAIVTIDRDGHLRRRRYYDVFLVKH